MKKALISGITGQDGSFLAEFLLQKGYEVHGILRRSSSFNTGRIEHLYFDEWVRDMKQKRTINLHYGDMTDSSSLIRIIQSVYGSGKEIMSNFEWDRLYDELVQLEGETGIVMANSPTVNVGELDAVLSGFEKVQHEISVKSLDKTKDVDTLAAFIGGCPGIMSWKLDGLTIVLTYDNRWLRSSTRP